MIRIANILTAERVLDITSTTKDETITELCGLLKDAPEVNDFNKFCSAIRAREAIMSTGIGAGIAIPHSKTSSLNDLVMAVGRTKQGLDFDSLDGLPVHLIILVGSSITQGNKFLKILAEIGRFFNDTQHLSMCLEAETPLDMYKLLIKSRH